MNQQEAKNILDMKEFLRSLETIVSSFKASVDGVNTKIEATNKRLIELDKKVDSLSEKLQTLDVNDEFEKLSVEVSDLKKEMTEQFITKQHFDEALKNVEEIILKETEKLNTKIETSKSNDEEAK